jgi:hypothetical protein
MTLRSPMLGFDTGTERFVRPTVVGSASACGFAALFLSNIETNLKYIFGPLQSNRSTTLGLSAGNPNPVFCRDDDSHWLADRQTAVSEDCLCVSSQSRLAGNYIVKLQRSGLKSGLVWESRNSCLSHLIVPSIVSETPLTRTVGLIHHRNGTHI